MELESKVGGGYGNASSNFFGCKNADSVALSEASSELKGHQGSVNVLRSYVDGRFVSGSDDGKIGLWDLEGEQCIGLVDAHDGPVTDVQVMVGGAVVSSGDDGVVRVWDTRLGKCIKEVKGHTDAVNQLATIGNVLIASAGIDGAMKIWSLRADRYIGGFQLSSGPVWSVAAVGPNKFAAGSIDGRVRVIDLKKADLTALTGHRGSVWQLQCTDGGMFASGSADGSVILWSAELKRPLKYLEGHTASVDSLAYLSEGLLLSGSFDRTAIIWDLRAARSKSCKQVRRNTLRGHQGFVRSCIAYKNLVATSSNDHTVRLWSTRGAHLMTLKGEHSVEALTNVQDTLIAGSLDGKIFAWKAPQDVWT